MYKKTIKYVDYNDIERSEDFYFNLSKAEVAEKELTHPGGYGDYLKRIIDSGEPQTIVNIFKDLILDAYGQKSDDGRRFIKSEALRDSFSQTEAYSELFLELATNHNSAIEFIVGIMPRLDGLDKEAMKKQIEANSEEFVANPELILESVKQDA